MFHCLTKTETRELLDTLGHKPKKKLGQNFLIDPNIVEKSLRMAGISSEDTIVEVGPGLGTLTRCLLNTGASVYAVEKDDRLHEYLKNEVVPAANGKLHLIHADAMDYPRAELPDSIAKFKIAANLPYAITTPWMEAILGGTLPQSMVLMVQKEAAQRLSSSHNHHHFSPISIFLASAFDFKKQHPVPGQCFLPAPDVSSALVYFERKVSPFIFSANTRLAIRQIFTQRRKQIQALCRKHEQKQLLGIWLEYLIGQNIKETARPDEIALEHWQHLEKIFSDHHG